MPTGICMIRDACENDIEPLARLWHDGWHEAHGELLPRALCEQRTLESFQERLTAAIESTRAMGPPGTPIGFSIVRGDELYQFYVAAAARGTGAAAVLIADAERRMAEQGVRTAWLSCAIGNHRAARFYEKCGWFRAGTVDYASETASGPFILQVWRYEKDLRSL